MTTPYQQECSRQNAKPYVVDFWGSEPMTNDDCWTGEDFDTLEEAESCFHAVVTALENGENAWGCCAGHDGCEVAFVVIDGPDVHREHFVKESSHSVPERDDLWESEFAMQSGMAFGCQGYNDAMGY